MNAFVDQNRRLNEELATVKSGLADARNELVTVKSELAATRNELTTTLTRIGTVERGLHELGSVGPKLEEMDGNYERLSNLLKSDHLFSSETFRVAIRTEVKNSFGHYWPSAKSDMEKQLWKKLPQPVTEYVEKEIDKLVDKLELIRSELVEVQQTPTTDGNVQNENLEMTKLKQAVERIEKKYVELEAAMPRTGRAPEFERTRRSSTSSVPGPTPNNTGNST